MTATDKILFYSGHPWSAFDYLMVNFFKWIPDVLYLKCRFRARMGKWPDFKNPETFNEKINWMKLHLKDERFCTMVDKYRVKEYVRATIGSEYVIPNLGVWDSPSEIEWDKLPDSFVLKTTHGGGGNGVVICPRKEAADKSAIMRKLEKSLDTDIGASFKEWPYKNIPKRIIAEEYLHDGEDLNDYKFFCFNGKVRCFKIDFDRFKIHKANYYDEHCQILPFGESDVPPDFRRNPKIPENLGKMIELAEQLSSDLPFVRVDMYNVKGRIYFGELTFYPASGMGKFTDYEWDKILGSWIKLNSTDHEKKN